jgi:predicted kinase
MRKAFKEFMNRALRKDTVLFACGLPASNKIETTEVIARIKGYSILPTDLIPLEALKSTDIFDEKVASNMDKCKLIYNEMFRRAGELAPKDQGGILDAPFITRSLSRQTAEMAANNKKTLVIQLNPCPPEVSLQRISQRKKENFENTASDSEDERYVIDKVTRQYGFI